MTMAESAHEVDPAFVLEPTIEVTDTSKWFGQKVAVSNLSCSFGPGVTGVLGPNGAGKTTLLRLIAGLTAPSNGTVRVKGKDPRSDHTVYSQLSLVPDEDAVYPTMTGRQFVTYMARLSGAGIGGVESAISTVQMGDASERPIGEYSKGMRQRIKVAAALAPDPDVLILDEPLNGTDPIQRGRLIELFESLGRAGKTVIVSSHVLEEVERVSTRVVAIVDGRLAAAGSVQAIRAAMRNIPYVVRIGTDRPRELGASLFEDGAVDSAEIDDANLIIRTKDVVGLGRRVAPAARSLDAQLTEYLPQDESLESVFRYLVERR